MKERIFYASIAGFAGGVFLRSFWNFGAAFSAFFVLLGGALFLHGRIYERGGGAPPRRGAGLFLLSLFLFSVGLGMLRFDLSELRKRETVLESRLGVQVTMTGIIATEPDEREDSLRLIVKLDSFISESGSAPLKTKLLAVTDLYPKFKYGDRLELSGVITKPKNFADPSGKIFDYRNYLAKEGVYYQMNRPKVKLIASGEGNFMVEKLFELKQGFLENVEEVIPEPHASLLGGLVVGAKRSLGKNLLDDFRRAGVIHIVVLSGYNLTIVADSVMKFFGFLPRSLGQLFGAVSIILFAIMTGGGATVVRASAMALLVIFARALGRRYDITRALLLAGFLMVLQNPKILVFDSSFQLSFMATLALIYVSPHLERRLGFVTEKWGLRAVAVATLSTQIFLLPMLLYKMGELSLVAMPTNLLILSAIPATMLFGFLAGVVGFISTTMAFPFAFVAYGLLEYELRVVEFFSHLPFASFAVSNFPLSAAVFAYVVYVALIMKMKRN